MGSLERLDDLILSHDCIILICAGKIICGCSKQFPSLSSLAEHISRGHNKVNTRRHLQQEKEQEEECLQEYFRKNFSFPQQHKNAVTITLPDDITCVCLSEHDIGAYSSNLRCHICNILTDNLDSLNKHIASVHRMSHILVGHNIMFEKPDASAVKPAFYCPMVKCKYHVAESFQRKHFKSFKLLKQHYVKVHASKEIPCTKCDLKFASQSYLDIHLRNCGQTFACDECDKQFPSLESLQTHARRNNHKLPANYQKTKQSRGERDPALDKLAIIQNCPRPGKVSIAPKPSPMHINAAIALSEMSASYKPRADIGVQTDADMGGRHRKSCTPSDTGHVSPSKRVHSGHVSAETQTRTGSRKRPWRPYKVSSQVQTLGEFTVKAKRSRQEDHVMETTETQCRMSPTKKMKTETMTSMTNSVTTMTNMTSVLESCHVDTDLLWPLRCHTNGTQTSPRVARMPMKTHDEDDDSDVEGLDLPGLESVPSSSHDKPKFGEIRQFSTETQTELDIFLDNYEDVERLLTTEMETQTHEGEENLLLFANNCTQTGTEDFLSALMIGGDSGGDNETPSPHGSHNNNPFKMDYISCSAETQTRLTGFQEQSLLLQIDNNQVMINDTETQTPQEEIMDFMEI